MSLDPNQLAALGAILRSGSFERAAADLGVTPSAISQRLKMLEDRMGATLVQRGPPARATALGQRLAKHAEDVRLLEAQLTRDVSPGHPGEMSCLRFALPADSLATWVMPALAAVSGLTFDLVVDDQDHSAEWLRRGEVNAAITSREKPVTGHDCVGLGALRYTATASPGFAARWFRDGFTAAAFAQAPMMVFNQKDRLQHRWAESLTGAKVSPPSHFLPSTHAFVDGALAGLGWGMNPEPLVRQHIASGRLVALAPDAPLDTPLYWQVSRIMAPALTPLTKALRQAARRILIQA